MPGGRMSESTHDDSIPSHVEHDDKSAQQGLNEYGKRSRQDEPGTSDQQARELNRLCLGAGVTVEGREDKELTSKSHGGIDSHRRDTAASGDAQSSDFAAKAKAAGFQSHPSCPDFYAHPNLDCYRCVAANLRCMWRIVDNGSSVYSVGATCMNCESFEAVDQPGMVRTPGYPPCPPPGHKLSQTSNDGDIEIIEQRLAEPRCTGARQGLSLARVSKKFDTTATTFTTPWQPLPDVGTGSLFEASPPLDYRRAGKGGCHVLRRSSAFDTNPRASTAPTRYLLPLIPPPAEHAFRNLDRAKWGTDRPGAVPRVPSVYLSTGPPSAFWMGTQTKSETSTSPAQAPVPPSEHPALSDKRLSARTRRFLRQCMRSDGVVDARRWGRAKKELDEVERMGDMDLNSE